MWARFCLWMLKWCVGTTYRVEGKENLPESPFIIASKHQSAWETMAFNHIFPKTSFVLKKELSYFFPLNLYMSHSQMIPLDRQGSNALKVMIQKAKNVLVQKRTVVIFPEGTRSAVGHKVPYKRGIYVFYKHLNCPVVPVALNSGVFWKRRGFLKYPGTIIVKILPAIQPGLDQQTFMDRLERDIEENSLKIVKI